jgi:hypothetical protein
MSRQSERIEKLKSQINKAKRNNIQIGFAGTNQNQRVVKTNRYRHLIVRNKIKIKTKQRVSTNIID